MPSDALDLNLQARRGRLRLDVRGTLPESGVTALTGPSGAGKSTLLRLIAGLDRPERGEIRFGGETWVDTRTRRFRPPHKRPVGMMFQDGRLFPHLSVRQNLSYAHKRRETPVSGPDWDEVIGALDLTDLLERQPLSLSGGEQRRVALGRTLLTGPQLLLLDEPLTGLDRARKRSILPYIERAVNAFAIPTVYVSHDLPDIARLADHLWVMEDGRLTRTGPADRLLSVWSEHSEAASGARLTATVQDVDDVRGILILEAGGHVLNAPRQTGIDVGSTVRLWIRADDVAIATSQPGNLSIRNILPVTITAVHAGAERPDADLTLDFLSRPLLARVSRASLLDLDLKVGQPVYALLKTVRLEDSGL